VPADTLDLARQVLEQARRAGLTLATAESCTGGLVAAALTAVPGSSDVVEAGLVAYSNAAKTALLRVKPKLIARHGAVSEPVARAMAEGALKQTPARLAVSVTGIAGPGGGTPDKPVGLVWFATALPERETLAQSARFGDLGREAVRQASVRRALELLLARLQPVGAGA
jgi:nicotinamide-nucleotide amidase